jgi:hypothetical protein
MPYPSLERGLLERGTGLYRVGLTFTRVSEITLMNFWYSWPSWVTEICRGLILASLVQVFPILWLQAVVAVGLSVFYETILDVNGWSLKDVLQRAVGIAGGLCLWWIIR